jgi:hypothetical protein
VPGLGRSEVADLAGSVSSTTPHSSEGVSPLRSAPTMSTINAASLLPGLLAATRTGLPPASDDELYERRSTTFMVNLYSAGRTKQLSEAFRAQYGGVLRRSDAADSPNEEYGRSDDMRRVQSCDRPRGWHTAGRQRTVLPWRDRPFRDMIAEFAPKVIGPDGATSRRGARPAGGRHRRVWLRTSACVRKCCSPRRGGGRAARVRNWPRAVIRCGRAPSCWVPAIGMSGRVPRRAESGRPCT